MSLEGSEKNDDIYDQMLGEERRSSLMRNSNKIKSKKLDK